jgi:hypothetical protein
MRGRERGNLNLGLHSSLHPFAIEQSGPAEGSMG